MQRRHSERESRESRVPRESLEEEEPEEEDDDDETRRVVADMHDDLRRSIIQEYEQDRQDQASMRRAMQEAEVALMPSAHRMAFAAQRLERKRRRWERDWQRILSQYRNTVLSCSPQYYPHGEHVLRHTCPCVLLPRAVGERVLRQIFDTVHKQMGRKYGTTSDARHLIDEMNQLWFQSASQYLGLVPNSVPHPDVLPCIVPNVSLSAHLAAATGVPSSSS